MKYIILISVLFFNTCTKKDEGPEILGPDLDTITIAKTVKKDSQKYQAYESLKKSKEEISLMDINEQLKKLSRDEVISLKKRTIELRKTFNDAVKSYNEIGNRIDAYDNFQKYYRVLQDQKRYIVKNYGV